MRHSTRHNRWTAPLGAAALLAGPAVLLGWHGAALASAVAAPWTEAPPAAVPAVAAPSTPPGPTSAPSASETGEARTDAVPASAATRTVVIVHTTRPQPVEANVSETTPSASTERPGTDSGNPPIDQPVQPSDPTTTDKPTPPPDDNAPGDLDPTDGSVVYQDGPDSVTHVPTGQQPTTP